MQIKKLKISWSLWNWRNDRIGWTKNVSITVMGRCRRSVKHWFWSILFLSLILSFQYGVLTSYDFDRCCFGCVVYQTPTQPTYSFFRDIYHFLKYFLSLRRWLQHHFSKQNTRCMWCLSSYRTVFLRCKNTYRQSTRWLEKQVAKPPWKSWQLWSWLISNNGFEVVFSEDAMFADNQLGFKVDLSIFFHFIDLIFSQQNTHWLRLVYIMSPMKQLFQDEAVDLQQSQWDAIQEILLPHPNLREFGRSTFVRFHLRYEDGWSRFDFQESTLHQ